MPARKFLSALLLLLTLCLLLASRANAVQPDEVLPDPALEVLFAPSCSAACCSASLTYSPLPTGQAAHSSVSAVIR